MKKQKLDINSTNETLIIDKETSFLRKTINFFMNLPHFTLNFFQSNQTNLSNQSETSLTTQILQESTELVSSTIDTMNTNDQELIIHKHILSPRDMVCFLFCFFTFCVNSFLISF